MTAPASPKELLTEYRKNARLRALDEGAPTDRADFPGLSVEPSAMIYTRGKKLTYQPMAGQPVPLLPTQLQDALTSAGACTVVADRPTFARMQTMMDNLPSNDRSVLGRRLRIIAGLPVSLKLPVLTDALSYRYWLPDGMAENSLADWAKAFDVEGPTDGLTMRQLIRLACEGRRPAGLNHVKATANLESLERTIMDQSGWSGISSDCTVFSMMEKFGEQATGLRVLDPGLLEMHTIDGQVCRIVPMNITDRDFSASVSSPFKLKEGGKVRISDGSQVVEVLLESLRYGAGALHAVLSLPLRGPGRTLVASAKAGTSRLYASTAPYGSRGAILKNRRWLSTTPVERITGRDVPLDVALAGAPTD